MKKSILSLAAATAVAALTGCGSSSSTTDATATVATGTAYYLDSAVSGVNYRCGTIEGITDADGKFTFEKGQNCTFYLGDVKLREMEAATLEDGKKIVEDNIAVATLLQSLDINGDPTDGITITPEVVEVVTQTLTEEGGEAALPTTPDEIEALVAAVESNVTDFNGTVVSETEAEEHLQQTQLDVATEETKALLAGKTFYTAGQGTEVNGDVYYDYGTAAINADASTLTWTPLDNQDDEAGSFGIKIEGNKIIWLEDNSYSIVDASNTDYILVTDYDTSGRMEGTHRLYTDEAKAQAYYETLVPTSPTTGDLNTLIVDRTLYQHCTNGVESLYFDSNGTLIFNEDANDTIPYRIDGNTVITTEDNEDKVHTLQTYSDEYITFAETSGDYTTFYYTEALALNAPAEDCGEGDSDSLTKFTTEYLAGKSFYLVQYDDFGYDEMKWNMARMDFTDTTVSWTEYDTEDTTTHIFDYNTTDDGKIVIDEVHFEEITLESQTNDYLKVCEGSDCNTYLFFDEAQAMAFRDNQNTNYSYYILQEEDIAGHTILVGDPSKDKAYATDHTFTSLESDVNDRDTGTWSIVDGKLQHIWSDGTVEIYSFSQKPAVGVILTNETYGVSGEITGYE